MTKARMYSLASGASSITAATVFLMRDSLPKNPADFAGGFFVALAVAFLFSSRLSTAGIEEEE